MSRRLVPRSPHVPLAGSPYIMAASRAAPSTMAASITWPWPDRLGLEQPADHSEGQQHAAAAEVADQVERRDRRLAGPADQRRVPLRAM